MSVLATAFLRLRHLPHRSQIGLARVDVFAGTRRGGRVGGGEAGIVGVGVVVVVVVVVIDEVGVVVVVVAIFIGEVVVVVALARLRHLP